MKTYRVSEDDADLIKQVAKQLRITNTNALSLLIELGVGDIEKRGYSQKVVVNKRKVAGNYDDDPHKYESILG